jgi:hypothetical protein
MLRLWLIRDMIVAAVVVALALALPVLAVGAIYRCAELTLRACAPRACGCCPTVLTAFFTAVPDQRVWWLIPDLPTCNASTIPACDLATGKWFRETQPKCQDVRGRAYGQFHRVTCIILAIASGLVGICDERIGAPSA